MVPSLQVSTNDNCRQKKSLTKCRADVELVKKKGKRKAFHTGGDEPRNQQWGKSLPISKGVGMQVEGV